MTNFTYVLVESTESDLSTFAGRVQEVQLPVPPPHADAVRHRDERLLPAGVLPAGAAAAHDVQRRRRRPGRRLPGVRVRTAAANQARFLNNIHVCCLQGYSGRHVAWLG